MELLSIRTIVKVSVTTRERSVSNRQHARSHFRCGGGRSDAAARWAVFHWSTRLEMMIKHLLYIQNIHKFWFPLLMSFSRMFNNVFKLAHLIFLCLFIFKFPQEISLNILFLHLCSPLFMHRKHSFKLKCSERNLQKQNNILFPIVQAPLPFALFIKFAQ